MSPANKGAVLLSSDLFSQHPDAALAASLPHVVAECPIAALRARSVADARRLRVLAWIALRDGMPMPENRAVASRAAARAVLANAKRISALLGWQDRPWTHGL